MNVFTFTVFCIETPVCSIDPDQVPHFVASEPSLHCLLFTVDIKQHNDNLPPLRVLPHMVG